MIQISVNLPLFEFSTVNKKAIRIWIAFHFLSESEKSYCSELLPFVASRSNTKEKRSVFDNGFCETPEPEGTR